jgi:hypothetical protein
MGAQLYTQVGCPDHNMVLGRPIDTCTVGIRQEILANGSNPYFGSSTQSLLGVEPTLVA